MSHYVTRIILLTIMIGAGFTAPNSHTHSDEKARLALEKSKQVQIGS